MFVFVIIRIIKNWEGDYEIFSDETNMLNHPVNKTYLIYYVYNK